MLVPLESRKEKTRKLGVKRLFPLEVWDGTGICHSGDGLRPVMEPLKEKVKAISKCLGCRDLPSPNEETFCKTARQIPLLIAVSLEHISPGTG